MTSDIQIEANRLNARKSTGPRTTNGKARVSANALKHGLTAHDIIMPYEKAEDFESFRSGLFSSLEPQGELEETLAERIAVDAWRLRRIPILEAALYRRRYQEVLVEQAQGVVRNYAEPPARGLLESLLEGREEVKK